MNTDLTPCFSSDELLLASRLLAARAKRLGIAPGLLLRAAIRDLVFDEAGRNSLCIGGVRGCKFTAWLLTPTV